MRLLPDAEKGIDFNCLRKLTELLKKEMREKKINIFIKVTKFNVTINVSFRVIPLGFCI